MRKKDIPFAPSDEEKKKADPLPQTGAEDTGEEAEEEGEAKELLWRLAVSAVLLTAGLLVQHTVLPQAVAVVLFGAALLVTGWDVHTETWEHLRRGVIFDENLLMAVASVGAFALGEYVEGVAVIMLYQLGELLQDLAVERSRKSIADTMNIRPDHANLLDTDGGTRTVPPEQVPVGSLILIRAGEKVPLDCTVEEGISSLDTAALTGESLPRPVVPGDTLLSGCVNLTSALFCRTDTTYVDSTVQRILRLTQESGKAKSHTETFITRFARVYTPVVFALAALLAVVPPLAGAGDLLDWLYRALVFLVVSCPCALVISIPVGFLAGMGGAARRGVILKGGAVLDRLCDASVAVFDKTGTLTYGKFTVTDVLPAPGVSPEQLLAAAVLCEGSSTHPIAVSVTEFCRGKIEPPARGPITEVSGRGIVAQDAEGHSYLAGNRRLLEDRGVALSVPDTLPQDGTVLYVAQDGHFLGALCASDAVRLTAPAAIRRLRALGLRQIVMLTGDRAESAAEVAAQLHPDSYTAGLLPQDKVNAFNALGDADSVKLFVGDGINDAPLLARADVGFAMGAIGSDAAVGAADAVLMHDDPTGVATAIRCARRTRRIVRQNIVFALASKLAVLVAAALGFAPMWLAVFADVGVALLCVANAMRCLKVEE